MKFPSNDDFLVRMSSSLEGSNCVLLSLEKTPLLNEKEENSFGIGDLGFSWGCVAEDSSLVERFSTPSLLPSASTNPLLYCGYFAKTYC